MARFRIAYVIALLLFLFAFFGTNSVGALIGVILAVILLVSGFVISIFLTRETKMAFSVKPACLVGQELALIIDVDRPFFMPVGRIDGVVVSRNIMRGETTHIPFTLSAGHSRQVNFELPLNTDSCGRVELSVDSVRIFDPLALFRRGMKINFKNAYAVYPKLIDLSVSLERAPHATITGVTYDPLRKGQDHSEPFEIRDYIESDSLRQVHWKLSTKLDRLVVREASHPSNYDILVLADIGRKAPLSDELIDTDIISGALDLTASISNDLQRHGLGHNVAVRDTNHYTSLMVDTPSSLDDMLEFIVSTPMPDTLGVDLALFGWFLREHAFTKVVLVTPYLNQGILEELGNLIDLSVVYIRDEIEATVDQSASYTLIGISVDALEDRVRNVVI